MGVGVAVGVGVGAGVGVGVALGRGVAVAVGVGVGVGERNPPAPAALVGTPIASSRARRTKLKRPRLILALFMRERPKSWQLRPTRLLIGYKIFYREIFLRLKRRAGADSNSKIAGATSIFIAKITPVRAV